MVTADMVTGGALAALVIREMFSYLKSRDRKEIDKDSLAILREISHRVDRNTTAMNTLISLHRDNK